MIRIIDKQDCCGCEACVQVCPRHCIYFEEDNEGFLYPRVDTSICIDCGLCEKVCPILNRQAPRESLRICAAKNRDEKVRLASSSGGVFTSLAQKVISQGGVVFGVRFNELWEVVHGYTEITEGIADFRTSKYVQSRIGNSFRDTLYFLRKGRKVLFTGTPCQIAALKQFLRQDYDNLLTVDIICHGVPSPKVWKMYLEDVKQNACQGENSVSSPLVHSVSEGYTLRSSEDVKIKSISFRDKRVGWKKFSFALTLSKTLADGKQNTVLLSHIHRDNPYMKGFLDNLYLRPSCHRCRFKKFQSKSDISLADFWAINKVFPDFYDSKGVSLVFVNTNKGESLMEACSFEYRNTSFAMASSNHGLRENVPAHRNRDYFFSHLDSTDCLESLIMKSLKPTFLERLMAKAKKFKRILK